ACGGIGVAGGAFVYCSRDAWRAVDGFNETLYVAEDVSFSSRLKRWGRARGLRYVVITEAKLVTSSRKLDSHGEWGVILHLLRLAPPGALRSPPRARRWDDRPTLFIATSFERNRCPRMSPEYVR